MDIRIERFELINTFLIDLSLRLIGIVLGPEYDLIIPGFIETLRHLKISACIPSVTGGKR